MRSTWAEQVLAMLRKDVLVEARGRASFNAMLFFSGIVVLVFSFALGPDTARLQEAAGGLLWLAFVFAGILAFERAYNFEAENAAFEGLLLVAQNRSAIYVGKVLGASALMFVVEAIVLVITAVLYNLNLAGAAGLIPVAILGTIGFASIGALYGALTMSLRAREVLLPLLLLPVTVPVILGAVNATNLILAGQTQGLASWLEVLVAFDVIFLTAGLLTFEYAAGD